MTAQARPAGEVPYPEAKVFRSPIRIGVKETTILADAATNAAIADAIARQGGAVFHDVLAPDLLHSLMDVAAKAPFRQVNLQEFGLRGNDLSVPSGLPFCLVLGRPVFMRWLEQLTGCDPIMHIEGHLVQMLAGNNLGWHRDAGLGIRRLAMVINLTTEPYEGGRFELRRKSTREPMFAYHAGRLGSLAVFRLGLDLQHQVAAVTAGGPRTSFTGWARGPWVEADDARHVALATWPPLLPPAA